MRGTDPCPGDITPHSSGGYGDSSLNKQPAQDPRAAPAPEKASARRMAPFGQFAPFANGSA